MTAFMQLFTSLREQMSATMSRSDVLKPLAWMFGLLLTATVLLVLAKGDQWILAIFVTLNVVTFLLYCGSYLYCMRWDRDALRSEQYSLQKMAIESRLLGDSKTGLLEEKSTAKKRRGAAREANQIEHKT